MWNKAGKITAIILLIIVAMMLLSAMIIAIVNKDKNFKIILFGIGNKTKMLSQNEYSISEISKIEINDNSGKIRFVEGDSDKVKVTIYGLKDEKYDVKVAENKLQIHKDSNTFYLISLFCFVRQEVEIQIPKSYQGDIAIQLTSGAVEMVDLSKANVQIQSHSGSVRCGNINNGEIQATSGSVTLGNANEIKVEVHSGSIRCGNAQKGDFKATSGSIRVGNMQEATLEANSGRIEVGNINKVNMKATSGSIKAGEVGSVVATVNSGSIRIERINQACNLSTKSGSVRIEECNLTQNSEINVKSGAVNIKKINDVFVNATAKSGSVKVKNANNRKAEVELKIQTTSGSIKVEN